MTLAPPSCRHEPRRRAQAPRPSARLFFAAVAAVLLSFRVDAGAEAVRTPHVTAELVAETQTVQPGEPFTIALSLRPEAGWHTYGPEPGDSGLPTRIEWNLPQGLRAGEIQWPQSVQLTGPPIVTYGYESDVLLPVRIEVENELATGPDIPLFATARWLACRDDACVPGKADLTLNVRVDAAPPRPDPRWEAAFAAARASASGDSAPPAAAGGRAPASMSPSGATGDETAGSGSAGDGAVTFWAAVVLAFLGGLVLNLMPCVFPVLSLKVLGFVHVAHHEPAAVRRHGYAFTVGVLVSFWILGGALLVLRAAGNALGWGFQLQEPVFVAAMAALLTAMSLNLLGVYELGATISGAVGRYDSERGYRGSFLSGVLATVLATPCSAPFMGTALGWALVQPAVDAVAVFTSLGAGMAAPYLVFSCAPALMRALPRPGAWMETFRILMAFPLLATVAWLVWVFGQQTGNDGVLALLLALLLGSLAVWLVARFRSGTPRAISRAVGAACLAAGVVLVASAARTGDGDVAAVAAAPTGDVPWQAWDPAAIERHRSEGRLVFVDFTADWCLSCKVNERVALSGDGFAEMLRTHEAVAMKADWTRADPRITEALAGFGRNAVPLYVVYPPDPAREPIILPQVLTPGLVRDAFERAVG